MDNIGTGLSSKPDDYKRDFFDCAEKSTMYMTTYIERWRKAMDVTNFYLLGHSYGGYMAGSYASKYHQHIKKLILCSPIGLKQSDDSGDYLKFVNDGQSTPWFLRGTRTLIDWAYNKKVTPLSIYRLIGSKNTKRLVWNLDIDAVPKEDGRKYYNYLSVIYNRKPTTEKGLMIDFKPVCQAYYPLTNPEKLCKENFPKPVSIIYGEQDWTDKLDGDSYK